MKALLLLLLLVSSCSAQTITEVKAFLIKWEGYKVRPYYCPSGHLTVGIGHALTPLDPKKSRYSDKEIASFFNKDYANAVRIAKSLYFNFEGHPKAIRLVLLSIIFTVGEGGIKKFRKFNAAILSRDYPLAAVELKDSIWFSQVGWERAKNHVETLKRS
jgi:lysozyme